MLFTWWHGATPGTFLTIFMQGKFVGEDGQGNCYYTNKDGSRRWVIYNGVAEASRIPPGWHGWIHYRSDEPPGPYRPREWEKPYLPNLTGTPQAYRPPGSILHGAPRTPARPDYEPWRPEK
jgi:NADH:ubiquinone oxidoreductase subunit